MGPGSAEQRCTLHRVRDTNGVAAIRSAAALDESALTAYLLGRAVIRSLALYAA